MLEDARLIVIPSTEILRGGRLIDACQAAEAGGATSVQVRVKDATASALLRATASVMRAVELPVYVNDRLDVACAAGAAGVHVGANDFPLPLVRRIAPRPMRVGLSVGSDQEAGAAFAADADYWSVGPFDDTASKADAGPGLGARGFRRLAVLAPRGMPVVAIGGVSVEKVPAAVAAGAAGVAVISAVFAAPDIERATRALRDALDRELAAR